MTIPVWPADLPQKMSREGFGRSLASGRRLGRKDSGPPRPRLRYSQSAKPVTGAFDLSARQSIRFERFWFEQIAEGAIPFFFPNQMTDGLPLLMPDGTPILTADGRPLLTRAWWLVLIDEADPSASALGGAWFRWTLSLLVMP
ncbi:hypothetical protein J2X65_003143 [Ancylobacter sp. 3268]|uniref:hypothetical protein n=1 Tax=Ancylobacter sp. 3268 TaxID=2817752 RepID=UPI00286781EF|nr:hypothetical protein [Ancylobacter sp. 3268]MDR6953780.1 hypothetical protein [Ancylobacter sp. 3268]